ncbi:MAG: hypothetical protein AAGA48_00225 [Myxococcota bacterium]
MQRSMIPQCLSAVVIAVLASACTGAPDRDEQNNEIDPGQEVPEATTDPTGDPEPTPEPSADLAYATVNPWGPVLVDGDGYVLYLFTSDWPSGWGQEAVSRCVGPCVDQWPPVIFNEPVLGEGLDAANLGWFTRDDGSRQVTWMGWPVYRFGGDTAPGQASGDGDAQQWFVVPETGYTHLPTRNESYTWLVGMEGRAYYYLADDDIGTPTEDPVSWCTDACLDTFPPATGPAYLPSALDPSDVYTFERPDGIEQLAYRGRPLYTYVEDVYPGDTKADGLAGRWFKVDPYALPPVIEDLKLDFDNLAPGIDFDVLTVPTSRGNVDVTATLVVPNVSATPNPIALFDAECGGSAAGCTGDDEDLFAAGQGQILVAQDPTNDVEPDDAASPAQFTFDLSVLDCDTIEVVEFVAIDSKDTSFSTIPGAIARDTFIDSGFPNLDPNLLGRFGGEPILVDQGVFHLYVWDSGAIDDLTIRCTSESTWWEDR